MRQARCKRRQAGSIAVSADLELATELDDHRVLEHLEADLGSDEDRRRINGILNGAAIGACLWILLLIAVAIAL